MIGNVNEWIDDCWHDDYQGAPEDGSAWGTTKCSFGLLRGGGWKSGPQKARTAYRVQALLLYYDHAGFRPVRVLP